MVIKYDAKTTVNVVASALNPFRRLYREKFINWTGKAKNDSRKRTYSEIIAEELLKRDVVREIKDIQTINREDYRVASHDGRITDPRSEEENFCKKAYNYCKKGKNLNYLGKVFDYQVPLKKVQTDDAGKIDLVSYDKESNRIYLIEVKKPDSKETLLRCIFEIATYYQLLNKENLIASYDELEKFQPKNIKKAVLIFKDSNQHKEFQKLNNNPHLKKLIEEFDIKIFSIKSVTEEGDVIKKIKIG